MKAAIEVIAISPQTLGFEFRGGRATQKMPYCFVADRHLIAKEPPFQVHTIGVATKPCANLVDDLVSVPVRYLQAQQIRLGLHYCALLISLIQGFNPTHLSQGTSNSLPTHGPDIPARNTIAVQAQLPAHKARHLLTVCSELRIPRRFVICRPNALPLRLQIKPGVLQELHQLSLPPARGLDTGELLFRYCREWGS